MKLNLSLLVFTVATAQSIHAFSMEYRIYSKADRDQCLGADGNSAVGTQNGKSPIFWSCADSPGPNAIWILDAYGHLSTKANPSQCLGAKGNSAAGTQNGMSPIFYSCAGSPGPNAQWVLELAN